MFFVASEAWMLSGEIEDTMSFLFRAKKNILHPKRKLYNQRLHRFNIFKIHKIISVFLVFTMALALCMPAAARAQTELMWEDFDNIVSTYSVNPDIPAYRQYIIQNPAGRPSETITVEAQDYTRYEKDGFAAEPERFADFEGMPGVSVYTDEISLIEYDITIREAGLYNLLIEYYPVEGKSSAIGRSIFIDGKLPFRELSLIELPRIWQNTEAIRQAGITPLVWEKDNRGNDLKPVMVESPEWVEAYVRDSSGYITDPLAIYLTAGRHTISLYSQREPMLLRRITLENSKITPGYEEALHGMRAIGARDTSGHKIIIEAEDAIKTSSQMLYPIQDQSSPAVTPGSAKYFINNTIGGYSWRMAGQWMEWNFTVPETGLYEITLHGNQNFRRGTYVSRRITLNGDMPFSELEDYTFAFGRHWRLDTLGSGGGEPFKFYLEAGKIHTLRMEAVLGSLGDIIASVRDSVYELNAIYRKIISRTGVSPDRFADYQIGRTMPELNTQMEQVRDSLDWALFELRRLGGQSSERERVLVTMRDQLSKLIDDNELFPRNIGSFRANIRACGAWLSEAIEQPLQLDSIIIHSPDIRVKIQNNTVIHRIKHEISRLWYSFIIDYNQVGSIIEEGDVITLWIGSGRDQANVVKALIDENFTRRTGIGVNVMLVDMSTLLQASLAGQGPDAAIQVAGELPMNFGLRGSVMDLSNFTGFENVRERFAESAMTPYEYGGATYALPETQVFPMMFYRKDILAELNIELPQTWDEVSVLMSELAFNHMEFGMLPSEQLFTMLLYQHGGEYYNENATRSALDREPAINAFRMYTEFYTDYKLERNTSVEERFRTGETPIIITDYTFYNNLQISAPELRGVWGFSPVPGMVQEDGSINRTVSSNGGSGAIATTMIGVAGGNGSACVMMSSTQYPEQVWQFLSWWTSAETQVRFGREMESLMGPAARVPTANLEAFRSMPWPSQEYRALSEQFQYVRGIPQVPGGYFTWRNVNNAFYAVTTPQSDRTSSRMRLPMPREELMDRVIVINDEIRYKRIEFGLPPD